MGHPDYYAFSCENHLPIANCPVKQLHDMHVPWKHKFYVCTKCGYTFAAICTNTKVGGKRFTCKWCQGNHSCVL